MKRRNGVALCIVALLSVTCGWASHPHYAALEAAMKRESLRDRVDFGQLPNIQEQMKRCLDWRVYLQAGGRRARASVLNTCDAIDQNLKCEEGFAHDDTVHLLEFPHMYTPFRMDANETLVAHVPPEYAGAKFYLQDGSDAHMMKGMPAPISVDGEKELPLPPGPASQDILVFATFKAPGELYTKKLTWIVFKGGASFRESVSATSEK